MEQQPLETPSPNAGSSMSITDTGHFLSIQRANMKCQQPKRVLEDQADSNPPKRLKDTSGSDDDGGSHDIYTGGNDKTITSTNPYSSPESQPPSRTVEVLPSIEVIHEPSNEGNESSPVSISNGILESIEKDQSRPPSPCTRPTTSECRLSSSTNSPSPAPAPVPSPSPSTGIFLAKLPYGLLSPTPVSSVTASPTPPASRWVNFSPSPRAESRSPFSSSYTSISEGEGDSDNEEWLNAAAVLENEDGNDEEWLDLMGQLIEEDMDDEELGDFFLWEVPQIPDEWIVPVPVPVSGLGAQEVGTALVDGSGDYDGDEEDDGDEDEDGDGPESTAGQNIFAPRYDSWPDFDHSDVPGGAITDYISDDESEWDIESDPLHEGPRYPGMNAFKLEGYTPVHDQPPDSGDQEPEETYITGDEDDESDEDDEDEDVWVAECKSELEAQWWGAEMRIIHYHPSMCI